MTKKCLFFFLLIVLILCGCQKKIDDVVIPNGFKISNFEVLGDYTLGNNSNNDDEKAGAIVLDNEGNAVVTMNVVDASAEAHIIVCKVSKNGSLLWSKILSCSDVYQPDSGENDETGGTAGSMDIDENGYIYIVGNVILPQDFAGILIAKLNENGQLVTAKIWKKAFQAIAINEALGYAIDVAGNYVYVVGKNGDNKIPLLCLNKQTMEIVAQHLIEITSGTAKRGYAVKGTEDGTVYIGGVEGSYPILIKINNAHTATPSIEFCNYVSLPYGTRIDCIDIDNTGIYISANVRGVITSLVAFKTDLNCNFKWGISFKNDDNDRNNSHFIKIIDNYVYVGGRIGLKELDIQEGDGCLLKLDKNNGTLLWARMYYTGTIKEQVCEHRLKGIGKTPDGKLIVFGQVYGGNYNYEHFYGGWIENKNLTTTQYNVNFTPKSATISNIPYANNLNSLDNFICNNFTITFQSSKDKKTPYPPDLDAALWILKEK